MAEESCNQEDPGVRSQKGSYIVPTTVASSEVRSP